MTLEGAKKLPQKMAKKLTEEQKKQRSEERAATKDKRKEAVGRIADLCVDNDTRNDALVTILAGYDTEMTTYQKNKRIEAIYSGIDEKSKIKLTEMLVQHWIGQLPLRSKEYGVKKNEASLQTRLQWVTEHWGEYVDGQKDNKPVKRLKPMSYLDVLELGIVALIQAADADTDGLHLGDVEHSELGTKLGIALSRLKESHQQVVSISRSAYNQMNRELRKIVEGGGSVDITASRKILDLMNRLLPDPAVMTEPEKQRLAEKKQKAEVARAKKISKRLLPSGEEVEVSDEEG